MLVQCPSDDLTSAQQVCRPLSQARVDKIANKSMASKVISRRQLQLASQHTTTSVEAKMANLNLQEIHDVLISVAQEAGRMIMGATPSQLSSGTKKNCNLFVPSRQLTLTDISLLLKPPIS